MTDAEKLDQLCQTISDERFKQSFASKRDFLKLILDVLDQL